MADLPLPAAVTRGDLPRVRALLAAASPPPADGVNAYDRAGRTPLMLAAVSPAANVELLQILLDHGADLRQAPQGANTDESVLSLALRAGNPEKVALLIRRGADIHYRRDSNYNALIDTVYTSSDRLLDLLRLLVDHGVDLNAVTTYQESGCRVLSYFGRFDALRFLLDAGADPGPLRWTPLLRAVALGSLDEVRSLLDQGAPLEDRDYLDRTPFLLALQTRDLARARLLQARGADIRACGRCGKPPLFYAIENHDLPTLRWLLDQGAALAGTDEFGGTPLMAAAENGDAPAVAALLAAGAPVDTPGKHNQTALGDASSAEIARLLLDAGADPRLLPFEARRALVGLPPEPDENLLHVSAAEFEAGRDRRFGVANPEKVAVPFWEDMVRAGITGWQAERMFHEDPTCFRPPVWCAQRFGQSLTFLPDGRIVQVAGEHEDHYDPDFCIYNDVFVHHPDGRIDLYAYPETVFPPTDFHTATLLGDFIYLVGSLGYQGHRHFGQTPVYRLDTRTFRLEAVPTTGEAPGWIYKHRAVLLSADTIRIDGGTVATWDGAQEQHSPLGGAFILRVEPGTWAVETAP